MLAENNGRARNIEPSVSMAQSKELEYRLMFLHEATDYLNKIVQILEITGSHLDNKQIDSVCRAAHSIKGGAAMMAFQTLSVLAHRLEDFFKPFKNHHQYPISPELKGLLLAIADQMRSCIALNFEGQVVDDAWLEPANTIFEQLYQFRSDFTDSTNNSDILSEAHEDTATRKESEHNVVAMLFETEVKECLEHLEDALANPEQYNLLKELLIVLEALSGLGEMLLIPAFSQLCSSITKHLDNTPERVEEIARIALKDLKRAQTAVLSGQIDSLPFEIELGDSLEQSSSTDFDTSSLQNEPEVPLSHNQHSIEQITEEEQLEFETFSKLNLSLPSLNNNEVSGTVCISIEEFQQLNELIESINSSSLQLSNLLKSIDHQRGRGQGAGEEKAGGRGRGAGGKTGILPPAKSSLPPAFSPPAPCLFDDDEVTIEFCDTIELQDTGGNFPSNSKKHTILVIDDSETIREFLKSLLLKAGYQVEIAEDGQVAIEKLQKNIDVSAVICDLDMPRVTGYDFLTRVKSDESFKHLPVAMLTSHTEDKHRQRAMFMGASAYFTKPCNDQDLLKTLKELVGTSPAI